MDKLNCIQKKLNALIKHNRKGINYPSKTDDWKKFWKNNSTIALNNLNIKVKLICPAYI